MKSFGISAKWKCLMYCCLNGYPVMSKNYILEPDLYLYLTAGLGLGKGDLISNRLFHNLN